MKYIYTILIALAALCSSLHATISLETVQTRNLAQLKHATMKELKQLKKAAEKKQLQKIAYAIDAACNIQKEDPTIRLSLPELVYITLFIECEFPRSIQEKIYYVPEGSLQLPAAIEFDPATQKTFIHLKDSLGSGSQKNVKKSILYSRSKPEIVATSYMRSDNPRERYIHDLMKNEPGIAPLYTITEHTNNGVQEQLLICKHYKDGSLDRFLKENNHLSLQEKICIASQMLRGVQALHHKEIAHLDLKKCNFFIQKTQSKKKPYEVALGDLGWSQFAITLDEGPLTYCKSISNMAPEFYLQSYLEPDEYYAAELFSLGTLFYELLYEKKAPWYKHVKLNQNEKSRNNRYKNHVALVEKATQAKRKALSEKEKRGKKLSKQDQFEQIILQMLSIDPFARGSAKIVRKKLERIQ
jgi:serine/threonine protein kinase